MVTTQVAAGCGMLGWLLAEWISNGKGTTLGAASGSIAGLVGITPAAGFVPVWSSIIIGALALKGLPEILREVSNFRMLAFGALLVMMMLIRPEGFLPARRPRMKRPTAEDPQEKAEEEA